MRRNLVKRWNSHRRRHDSIPGGEEEEIRCEFFTHFCKINYFFLNYFNKNNEKDEIIRSYFIYQPRLEVLETTFISSTLSTNTHTESFILDIIYLLFFLVSTTSHLLKDRTSSENLLRELTIHTNLVASKRLKVLLEQTSQLQQRLLMCFLIRPRVDRIQDL